MLDKEENPEIEEGEEVDSIPSKAMSKNAIVELVNELLSKENQSEIKSKKNITEWGDESDGEDETEVGESSDPSKALMDKDQKLFLDALKFFNKDSLEHVTCYSGSLMEKNF